MPITTPSRFPSSASVISPSLQPMSLPCDGEPFGPAPADLVTAQLPVSRVPPAISHRVRTLVENANHIQQHSPKIAADCWHEAGRILGGRGGRPGEAWECHSRALALREDHRPALNALRRLARRADDLTGLSHLLEYQIERSDDPVETTSLLCERAVLELNQGLTEPAMEALRRASELSPTSLVPYLLRLGVATRQRDEQDLARTLSVLAEHWPDLEGATELRLILALFQERLNQLDDAMDHLASADRHQPKHLAAQLARFRLALRLQKRDVAQQAIQRLTEANTNPVFGSVLKRMSAALEVLNPESVSADPAAGAKPHDPVWELVLLAAVEADDPATIIDAVQLLNRQIQSSSLQSAFAVDEALCRHRLGEKITTIPPTIDAKSPIGASLASFLDIETPQPDEPQPEGEHPLYTTVNSLDDAVVAEDWSAVAQTLGEMRQYANDEADHWSIAMAEAAIRIDKLDQTTEAIQELKSCASEICQRPLPSLIRHHDRTPAALAELALAEAQLARDDDERAWLLAWAGHHLEAVDRVQAIRVHQQALELRPSLLLSIAAVDRCSKSKEVLAEAYLNAASTTDDPQESARFLVLAGQRYLLTDAGVPAADCLLRALKLLPEDKPLRRSYLRLVLSHPSIEPPAVALTMDQDASPTIYDLMLMGALNLKHNPGAAIPQFESALQTLPDDPFAKLGLHRARIRSGRTAEISSNLLTNLRNAASPAAEAYIYQRLADIDKRYNNDQSSAVLSLLILDEKVPGHRPTLAQLVMHYLSRGRRHELSTVLRGLIGSLDDEVDTSTIAAMAWRSNPTDIDFLRLAVQKNRTSLLELVELEGLTTESSERSALLDRIIEQLPDSAVHISRRAEMLHHKGNHLEAAAAYEQALELNNNSIYDLLGALRCYQALDDYKAMVDTLTRVAQMTHVPEYRHECLLKAAQVSHDALDNPGRAGRLYAEIVAADPQNTDAFLEGSRALKSADDQLGLIQLLEARLSGDHTDDEQIGMLLELAALLDETNDRARAKKILLELTGLMPAAMDIHRWLGKLHRQDGDWDEAISAYLEAAKLAQNQEVQVDIFFTLGELYMDHSTHHDLAERSFVKVLEIDRYHLPALDRLVKLYIEIKNWNRAAKVLEFLAQQTPRPQEKIERLVTLARVMDQHLNRSKEAEFMLQQAHDIDPLDFAPVKAIAEIFKRQGDSMSYHIHLDRALASQTQALIKEPDREQIYGNIRRILTMKSEDTLAAMAAEATQIVGDSDDDEPMIEVTQAAAEVTVRIADPSFNDSLRPKGITAGLCETLKAVQGGIAAHFQISASQIGFRKGAMLDEGEALVRITTDLAPAFGVEPPIVLVSPNQAIRVAPGSPAAILVSQSVVENEDQGVFRFIAAACLKVIQMGLSLGTILGDDELRAILTGISRLAVEDFEPKHPSPDEFLTKPEKMRQLLSPETIQRIHPFTVDCMNALEQQDLIDQLLEIGYRAGFIYSGSLSTSVNALRTGAGKPAGRLAGIPGAGRLMSFVFSRDHVELRRQLGISFDY